jgi:hypothetical protein
MMVVVVPFPVIPVRVATYRFADQCPGCRPTHGAKGIAEDCVADRASDYGTRGSAHILSRRIAASQNEQRRQGSGLS